MARRARDSSRTAQAKDGGGALAVPKEFHDTDWSQKIAIAKEAKEAGAALRKDKPATFATRHSTKWKTS
jgi:hypothetical protein